MRKLGVLVLGLMIGSMLAMAVSDNAVKDTSEEDSFKLFQGSDKGMQWDAPLTRGQGKVVLMRMANLYDAKIQTIDEVLSQRIETAESVLTKKILDVDARVDKGRDQGNYALQVIQAQDKFRAEEISALKARISDLQDKLIAYKEQLDYVSRAKRDDIKAASLVDGAQEEWLRPWYAVVEIANAGANSYNKLEAGYDLKYSDLTNKYTLTPMVKLADNGLYFGFKGEIRFGRRQ